MTKRPSGGNARARGRSMQKLMRRPLIAVLLVTLLLVAGRLAGQPAPAPSASGSAAPPPTPSAVSTALRAPDDPNEPVIKTEQDVELSDDPVTLRKMGDYWFKKSNTALADKCYARAIKVNEANLYSRLEGQPWADALILEWKGDMDGAEKVWRKSFISDPQYTAYFLVHFSEHTKRQELLDALQKHVRAQVAKAVAGEQALIYVTKKGANRYLQVLTEEEAKESFDKGERLTYAYIPKLDLTNQTWPKRVGCQRCVVGTIHGFNAKFDEQFDFNGFILDELHLGKRWSGEVNKSAIVPGARFKRLYLDHAVIFGPANLEGIEVTGRVANLPFATFLSDTNFRNAIFHNTAELRYIHFEKEASLKGSKFHGSVYLAHSTFGGLDLSRVQVTKRPVHLASTTVKGRMLIEDSKFAHGIFFENADFRGDVSVRRIKIPAPVNFSRMRVGGSFLVSRSELKDVIFYGATVEGDSTFEDNIVTGRSHFALDALTYRVYQNDPSSLHKRYKLYQGDDDAEEDLTTGNQYGVVHVRDFTSKFKGAVSFANTNFYQFVGYERVQFGTKPDHYVSFYNTQFGAEAHFERAEFAGLADFRTIGGRELAFNHARFHRDWMLDDANVPGRLATTETQMLNEAALSLAGADIRSFGVDFNQLLVDVDQVWGAKRHRLFYEHCVDDIRHGKGLGKYLADPRLRDAKWDDQGLNRITDQAEVEKRAREICIHRAVDEFTRLRDSFDGRSMSDESDWAYWHLKHYINYRQYAGGDWLGKTNATIDRVLFEKAFGWGVLLENLLATSVVVVLIFAVLYRLFCANMEVMWDEQPTHYKDLPMVALLIISMHAFMGGFGNAEALVTNATSRFKLLFTFEILVGIIVITFFIGAYTRMVVG